MTVRHPWALAIIDGHKPIENRSHGFPLVTDETVLLHASKSWSNRGQDDPRVRAAYPATLDRHAEGYALRHRYARKGYPPPPFTPGVLGTVRIVGSHRATPECVADGGPCHPWGETEYAEASGKVARDLVHLELAEPRKLAIPVAARGRLGLWTAPDDLVDFIAEQLGATLSE